MSHPANLPAIWSLALELFILLDVYLFRQGHGILSHIVFASDDTLGIRIVDEAKEMRDLSWNERVIVV